MLYVSHTGSVVGEGPSCLSPQHYHGLGHMSLLSYLHFLNDPLHQDALGQLTQGFGIKSNAHTSPGNTYEVLASVLTVLFTGNREETGTESLL